MKHGVDSTYFENDSYIPYFGLKAFKVHGHPRSEPLISNDRIIDKFTNPIIKITNHIIKCSRHTAI